MSGVTPIRPGLEPAPVPFGEWLRGMEAALAEERAADVPCGACNACCRTSHFIHVRPEEREALVRLPRRLLVPAPGLPPGHLVLGYDVLGRCPMLVDGRCTVYAHRPMVCRTYDCRLYAATGVSADRPAIAAQVARWRFSHPSLEDRRRHDAVLAAVRFIREHPACLPTEAARGEPVRIAVLAVAVHDLFLGERAPARTRGGAAAGARGTASQARGAAPARACGATAAGGPDAAAADDARTHARSLAVTAAHERLFGDA